MASPSRRRLVKRLRKWPKHLLKRTARPALNRFLMRYSRVGDPVIFDNSLFPWIRIFEDHYDEIRGEAIRLGELQDVLPSFHELSPYQKRISKGSDWKTVWLHAFGNDSEIAHQLCPATAELIQQVPEMQTALFSILAPGAHIRAHKGIYKGLVNYHLGVIIPKQAEKCRMQVGDEHVVWQNGESIVFDDTNTHEVWNDSGEERVVLMLQFHRPLLPPGNRVSRLFLWLLELSPYLRTPRRNTFESDRRLGAAARQRGLLPAEEERT